MPKRQHQCEAEGCERFFTSKASLSGHMASQHGGEVIVCDCGRAYHDQNNFNRHQRGSCKLKVTTKSAFFCNGCDKEFTGRKDNAKRHLKKCEKGGTAFIDAPTDESTTTAPLPAPLPAPPPAAASLPAPFPAPAIDAYTASDSLLLENQFPDPMAATIGYAPAAWVEQQQQQQQQDWLTGYDPNMPETHFEALAGPFWGLPLLAERSEADDFGALEVPQSHAAGDQNFGLSNNWGLENPVGVNDIDPTFFNDFDFGFDFDFNFDSDAMPAVPSAPVPAPVLPAVPPTTTYYPSPPWDVDDYINFVNGSLLC